MILLPPPGITHLPNPVWMPGLCRHLRGEQQWPGRCSPRRTRAGISCWPAWSSHPWAPADPEPVPPSGSRDAALASHWSAAGVRRADWRGGHTGQPSPAGLSWAQSVAGPVAERSGLHSDELSEHWL